MNRNYFLGLALIIGAAILTAGAFIAYAIEYSKFMPFLFIIAALCLIGGLVAFFVPSKNK